MPIQKINQTDIKQHVTNAIIAQLEAGTPPWRKPWTGGKASGGGFPLRHNGETYKGINILMLWAAAQVKGYASNRWMTFKQARDLGGMVKKGEKATKSIYYGTLEHEGDEQSGESGSRIQYAKAFSVFNTDQIEGLPAEYYILPDPPKDLGTQANADLDAFFAATGAEIITTDKPAAYYQPSTDIIHMPPIATFHSASGYYFTLSHECGHWVSAEPRLATQKAINSCKEYAYDELVSEITACFLAVQLGFDPEFDQSAAYLESWLKALKADKSLIFKAAAEAQKAVDHINVLVNTNQPQEAAA